MLRKIFHPLLISTLSLALLVFLGGFAMARLKLYPSGWLGPIVDDIGKLLEPDDADRHFINPGRHDFDGAISYDANGERTTPDAQALASETILLTSYWERDGRYLAEIRAIDRAGTVLHRWPIDIKKIWPEPPFDDPLSGRFARSDNYVHGSYLFENGDVLANIEHLGLIRMNAAGDVVWLLKERTHHSVHRAENGNFWVSATRWVTDQTEALKTFPGLRTPFIEDFAFEVTPDGELVREVSVLDAVFKSHLKPWLWSAERVHEDVVHLNDVEPLPSAIADQYPTLEVGDLVVSARRQNMVLVIRPATGAVVASIVGRTLKQHDPDFLGDGWISIFDNRTDPAGGLILGGSRLVAWNPATNAMRDLYTNASRPDDRWFFAAHAGKAQRLDNGHWLITEAPAGRVFEIDENGRTVWEWCQSELPTGQIVEVHEGTLYPIPPSRVRSWSK